MRRREFMTLLGVAAAWPLAVRAQQPAMPVVGFLRTTPAATFPHLVIALREGLKEEGFVEGQNVAIEQRWADNEIDRLQALAADLVSRRVAVIVANHGAAEVARAATATIPIVFVTGNDPITSRFVTSLSRPGGNLTGVTFFGGAQLGGKKVQLLHELVPQARLIAILTDPSYADFVLDEQEARAAARSIGRQVVTVKTENERGINAAFATIVQTGAGALLVSGGPIHTSNRQQIVDLAARHKVPAIYSHRDYVEAGGLISYSASFTGAYRQAGVYAGKILKGAKPTELPVLQPTTFETAINLKAAKALGLDVPSTIMLRADEVIE